MARLERLRTELQESLQNLKLVEPEMRKSQRLTTTWNPGTAGLRKPESERKEGNAEEEKDKGISEGHVGKSGLKIGYMEYDKSKILISTKRCSKTSEEIYKLLLEKYRLQMEMRAGSYILAMTSIADTDAGFERLKQALLELDKSCRFISTERTEGAGVSFALPRMELVYLPGKAEDFRRKNQTECCRFEEGEGQDFTGICLSVPTGNSSSGAGGANQWRSDFAVARISEAGILDRRNQRTGKIRGNQSWVKLSISWEKVLPENTTIFQKLKEALPEFKTIVLYTTRPIPGRGAGWCGIPFCERRNAESI